MQRTWADEVEDKRRELDRERLGYLVDVTIFVEDVGTLRVEHGTKRFRAHIRGRGFDHHAEADNPQKALILAALRWHGMSGQEPCTTVSGSTAPRRDTIKGVMTMHLETKEDGRQ